MSGSAVTVSGVLGRADAACRWWGVGGWALRVQSASRGPVIRAAGCGRVNPATGNMAAQPMPLSSAAWPWNIFVAIIKNRHQRLYMLHCFA